MLGVEDIAVFISIFINNCLIFIEISLWDTKAYICRFLSCLQKLLVSDK